MDHNFYSSRSERLSHASSATKKAYEKRKKVSYFKRNPHMKILVIDLVLVLLFGVIIIPFFIKITKDVRFDDFKVSSKGIVFEENILISIKISKLYKKISTRVGSDNIELVVSNGNISLKQNDTLPIEPGEDKYITFKLDDNVDIKTINVRISSGDFIKNYKIQVER